VIADSRWRIPSSARILQEPGRVIIAGSEVYPIPASLAGGTAQLLPLPERDGKPDLHRLMQALADEQINELQVEAGAGLCGALLRNGLVDEILLYQAAVILGEEGAGLFAGLSLQSMQQKVQLQLLESCFIGQDQRLRLRPLPTAEEQN
jgi:diaminohydroxyphosphoribosylaminopyrimidine deaminase/5-amino-6-(5-phosphoribosylamino)uracil reductase